LRRVCLGVLGHERKLGRAMFRVSQVHRKQKPRAVQPRKSRIQGSPIRVVPEYGLRVLPTIGTVNSCRSRACIRHAALGREKGERPRSEQSSYRACTQLGGDSKMVRRRRVWLRERERAQGARTDHHRQTLVRILNECTSSVKHNAPPPSVSWVGLPRCVALRSTPGEARSAQGPPKKAQRVSI